MTPVVAHCQWFCRHPPRFAWEPTPSDAGGPAVATCRASLGTRYVTIWLPQGARTRCRIPRGQDPYKTVFRHRYGISGDDLIEIRLQPHEKDSPNGES